MDRKSCNTAEKRSRCPERRSGKPYGKSGFFQDWRGRLQGGMVLLFLLALILSGIRPLNRFSWLWMALVPVLILLVLLAVSRWYKPSLATSGWLFLQCLLLLAGAHYEFHAIPFLRVRLPDGSVRAIADWLTHFVDGLAYAAVLGDLFRTRFRRKEPWRYWLSVFVTCLGLSGLWELVEWIALRTTNDVFKRLGGFSADTAVDIGLTLLGGLFALACHSLWTWLFSRRNPCA